MKTYGPYVRKDGRAHVIVIDGSSRRTVSYPKWLMEQRLGRRLDPNMETINHINGDFTDNRWENLEILPRAEHARKDAKPAELYIFNCPMCGKEATKFMRNVRDNNIKHKKAGPFCGKSCAGRYSTDVQYGRI